ncbi:MAG TPA: CHRD domain-containing protein [Candidatus Solibacter sp.]|nr:CHRD domain-containing protein [Candidatus Solibacter sp.]
MAQSVDTIPFLAVMQPGNEVPAVVDTSSGNAIIWVHVVKDAAGAITSGSVDFDVSTKFSGAVTATGLHIHNGAAGVAAGIVIPTDLSGTNTVAIDATGKTRIQKQVQFPTTAPALPVSIITDLIANPQGYYANIHTTANPGGAMRGQLMRADMKVLMGLMSPKNEVPPTGVNASGVADVVLLRAHDATGAVAAATAIFNMDYTGFDAAAGTSFTGFHIHSQTAGNNGSVVINTGIGAGAASVAVDPSGSGNLNYVVAMSPLDASWATAGINGELNTVNSLFLTPGNQYINAHTDKFGGGVMRDQMRNTERIVFQVTMLPANEVPPVTGLAATGPSEVPIYLLRSADGSVAAGATLFDVNVRGFPAPTTFTGLHIHDAGPGLASGVVFPSGLDGNLNKVVSDTGNGNIWRLVNVTTASAIAKLNALVQNPNGFYLNVHTTVNGGGAAREQLAPALAKPTVGGVTAVASTLTTVAPGGIMSIFGTGLSPITSDLSGFAGITALTAAIDGVSVTIGGVKAPFYFVSPLQINVQVPFEVAAGPQPVVVTTTAGATAAFTATVASAQPSIFVVDTIGTGAVVKNSDFSLITATNKAKAGDVIVIYLTGLGQTTPAMTTGTLVVPPAAAFNNTTTVTVSIGGQNAAVIYSIGSPGFAGLYQTAVTIPAGVTGSAPVIVSSGTTKSNTVNISVQ